MIVDAHLHLWDLSSGGYHWLSDEIAPVNRTFTFAEAEPLLRAAAVDSVVLVQADNTLADTEAMMAVDSPLVGGVVGWVDLLNPAGVAGQLDHWAESGPLVGIRHLIHDEPDPHWLGQGAVHESLAVLAGRGLSFDVIGTRPEHLQHALALAESLPELRLVIDHLGSPPLPGGAPDAWDALLAELAAHPQVFAKLSGLTTLSVAGDDPVTGLLPYVARAVGFFGADRVLFGGDWPVSTLATDYARTHAVTAALLGQLDLSEAERDAIMGGSAQRAYRLGAATA